MKTNTYAFFQRSLEDGMKQNPGLFVVDARAVGLTRAEAMAHLDRLSGKPEVVNAIRVGMVHAVDGDIILTRRSGPAS
jgi:hypothetical protein